MWKWKIVKAEIGYEWRHIKREIGWRYERMGIWYNGKFKKYICLKIRWWKYRVTGKC